MTFKLTDRQLAIARSGDPNFEPTDDDLKEVRGEVEQPSQEEQPEEEIDEEEFVPDETQYIDELSEEDEDTQVEPEASEEESWIDDSTIAEAESVGLNKDQLEALGSRDKFDQWMIGYDRKQIQDNQIQQQTEPPQQTERTQEDASTSAQTEVNFSGVDPAVLESLEKILGDEDAYEDEVVAMARGTKFLIDQETRREKAFQEQQQAQNEFMFHAAVDSLGHESLFGKSLDENNQYTKLSAEHLKNRQRMAGLADALARSIASEGHPVPHWEQLIKRVARAEFSDELKKQESRKRSKELRSQSAKRRGAGAAARPTKTRIDTGEHQDEAQRIASSPRLQSLWHDITNQQN